MKNSRSNESLVITIALLIAHVIPLAIPTSAIAALSTTTYHFESWGFTGNKGYDTPVDHVIGSLTITLDPDIDYGQQYVEDVTDGITLHSLNISLDSPIGFNYSSQYQRLNMGGMENGVDAITYSNSNPVTNDLWFNFRGMKSNPYFVEMCYAQAGIPDTFYSNTGILTVIPEPATLSLLTLGALLAGRKRRTV
jgi:hypothetical protein